ncbi:MAG: ATP-binding protein [bacterium]|nr:ATP-binding protein [bacterium]
MTLNRADEYCYHINLSLLKGSPVPCYLADTEGKLTFINPAMESLIGYSLEECMGQPASTLWSDAAPGIGTIDPGSWQGTVHVRSGKGEELLGQVTTTTFHDPGGGSDIVLGTIADLSPYQSALDTLRSRNDRLGALASIAARISVYGDTRQLAREAMQAVADLLPVKNAFLILLDSVTGQLALLEGYNIPYQEMDRYHIETSWEDCLEGRVVREKGAILIEDVSADPQAVHYEVGSRSLGLIPLLSRDRAIGVLSVTTQAPHSLNQEDMEFLVTLGSQLGIALENTRLIGALRDSNVRLQQQNQDLEELLSVISHDLRSPLATIGGYASLLMKKAEKLSVEEKINFAEIIFRKTKETSRRFDDLLDVFRVSLGQEKDEAVEVNPEQVIGQALVEAGFVEGTSPVRVDLPQGVPHFIGYPGHLMLIFTNLFSNALKFMGNQAEPRVTVDYEPTESSGRMVHRFIVADNGMGIPSDYLPNIFRPFTRGPSVEDIPGTGVGLASVNRIVRSHQGTVEIKSTAGEGTSVTFTLPWKVAG